MQKWWRNQHSAYKWSMPHTCSSITSIFMGCASTVCVPIYRHTNNQRDELVQFNHVLGVINGGFLSCCCCSMQHSGHVSTFERNLVPPSSFPYSFVYTGISQNATWGQPPRENHLYSRCYKNLNPYMWLEWWNPTTLSQTQGRFSCTVCKLQCKITKWHTQ
jgi:hypothetical protein